MTRIFKTAASPPRNIGIAVYAANDYRGIRAGAGGGWDGAALPGRLVEMGATEDPVELFRLENDPDGELFAAVIPGNVSAVEGAKVVAETALKGGQPAALVAMREYALLRIEESRVMGQRGRRTLGVFGGGTLTTMDDDGATRIILGIEESRTPVDARMPPITVPMPKADFVNRMKGGVLAPSAPAGGGPADPPRAAPEARTGAPAAQAGDGRPGGGLPKGRRGFPALGETSAAAPPPPPPPPIRAGKGRGTGV